MYHVMDLESPSEIWKTLEEQFLEKTTPNKLFLKHELYGLKMQEGTTLTEHVNAFNQVVLNLACTKVTVEDEDKDLYLLLLLPKSYKALVVTLTFDKTSITSSEVQIVILYYY
jgi:hypothetical protein